MRLADDVDDDVLLWCFASKVWCVVVVHRRPSSHSCAKARRGGGEWHTVPNPPARASHSSLQSAASLPASQLRHRLLRVPTVRFLQPRECRQLPADLWPVTWGTGLSRAVHTFCFPNDLGDPFLDYCLFYFIFFHMSWSASEPNPYSNLHISRCNDIEKKKKPTDANRKNKQTNKQNFYHYLNRSLIYNKSNNNNNRFCHYATVVSQQSHQQCGEILWHNFRPVAHLWRKTKVASREVWHSRVSTSGCFLCWIIHCQKVEAMSGIACHVTVSAFVSRLVRQKDWDTSTSDTQVKVV